MRVVVAMVVGGVAALHAPRAADACSCLPITEVFPSDGTAEVPLNVEVLVRNGGGDYVVEGPSGAVEIEVETLVDTGLYKLEAIRLAGGSGVGPSTFEAVTDYTLRSGEIALAQFRTGTEPDAAPPAAATITGLSLAHAEAGTGFS